MIYYIAGNFGAGNSLILAATANGGQHLRVTVHCYHLTSLILQCCPVRILEGNSFFVRSRVISKKAMRVRVAEKNFQLYNNITYNISYFTRV